MKKFRLLFILSFCFKIGFSQTAEKALKLVNFFTVDTTQTSTVRPTLTVPPGKIWKIENIMAGPSSSVFVNQINIINTGSGNGFYGYGSSFAIPPIWLNQGEKISGTRFRLSVFEFILE